MAQQPPPFGLILPPRPINTDPHTISPTQYAFTLPSLPAFTHIIVFLVPGTVLPPDTLAAVYIQFPAEEAGFRLLGAVGNERQSAIFRVGDGDDDAVADGRNNGRQDDGDGDEMTDAEPTAAVVNGQANTTAAQFTIGISVEPAPAIEAQLAALKTSSSSASSALVRSAPPTQQRAPQQVLPTKVLAQRIIKNAFNFLASFAGGGGGGEEMVPLRSFRGWWEKFERRVEMDPGFLERESDA